jgi:choline kinase
MKAVILAAGQGTRLEQKRPKCLVKIGGKRLIDRQLDALLPACTQGLIVVAGYQADKVRAAVDERGAHIKVVTNDAYATTNSLASLACARDVLGDSPCVVVNSDVLFHPWILDDVLGYQARGRVAYDSSSKFQPEQMKLLIRHGRLVAMSKGMPKKYMCGENVGLFFCPDGRALMKAATEVAKQRPNAWVPMALNALAKRIEFQCVDVAGLPWIEIDYPSDLQYARRVVLPAIEAT